ncbi:hypothetical protein HOP50_02g15740 [Chloropicon primus]|uniref:Uncharacterized protein n=1 Tax=Chloropicon primus TaxID=1764295 RepID=A0A5B8MH78_9CHLO|nr:hypothetical protein A3770_02p15830 [Chloropicon primus]UPQ98274.1 hypothetical protein HOP50_02g15740 [Chloropicon primus]|mmetsp:Transcript_8425/g.24081  ORF Transcript_8425/g.24081 Transcript_8425/m.24081 type:complete len:221 (+) Transcript_8425:289-951(+)|eukprot:QDZ19065.1 hypothetical protein A3770_02p15830 [Chloropicon primus]
MEEYYDKVRKGVRTKEVAEAASYCGLFGVVLGGAREWRNTTNLITEGAILQEEEKLRRKYPDKSFATPKMKRMLRYHASKEAHGLRMLKVCTSATKTCIAFGLISAAYVAVEQGVEAVRENADAWGSVCAGSALGTVIGVRWMGVRGAGVGALAGGALSFPFGHLKTLARSLEGNEAEGKDAQEVETVDRGVPTAPVPGGGAEETGKPSLWGRLVKRIKG